MNFTDALPIISAFGRSLLLAAAAIFPIANPPAMAPTFLSLTDGADPRMRAALAARVGRSSTLMMLAAMLIGTWVLRFFGLSLSIVRVAGGMTVATYAWHMLSTSTPASPSRSRLAARFTAEAGRASAFYPLTFPITCGPGTIAAAITVSTALHHEDLSIELANFAGGVAGCALVGLAVYFTYRFAHRLLEPLGETGVIVFLRMSAFILLCLGAQIIWTGASALLGEVLAAHCAAGGS